MGYFEARKERLIRNNDDLKNLADKVLAIDNTVEVYHNDRDHYIESITFFRGEDIVKITFSEVPFRWSGPSTRSAKNQENIAMPYTAENVLNSFKTVKNQKHRYDGCFESKKEYLDWCSYLVRYNG